MGYKYKGQTVDLIHYGFDLCIIQYENGKQESVSPNKIVDTKTNKVILRRTRPKTGW